MKVRHSTNWTKLAHQQLDEWIEGKIHSGFWPYGPTSDVLDLGILKTTMEKARKQWIDTHLPLEAVTIRGKQYVVDDIIEAIKGKEL